MVGVWYESTSITFLSIDIHVYQQVVGINAMFASMRSCSLVHQQNATRVYLSHSEWAHPHAPITPMFLSAPSCLDSNQRWCLHPYPLITPTFPSGSTYEFARIKLRNRCWPTTFHIIIAKDADVINGRSARIDWCDQFAVHLRASAICQPVVPANHAWRVW